ncbi:cytochrome P450 9e2-like [Uranotaenia lowii]|uniref:cytochrome P450 9e2-like n=1 Tax=Uranotaenia lowii TaxID=190385 RepID=UPI0024792675|nr:cytochrome P450 9e2-like [Uranotaenia lowii]
MLLLLTLGAIAALLLYRYATAYWDYFDRRGIRCRKPTFLLGHLGPILFQRTTPCGNLMDHYRESVGEMTYGFFEFRKPVLMLRDLRLVKQLFVKDFDSFLNHTVPIDEHMDSILGNGLISLKGRKWKDMRSTLSPMFTGSKIRHMLPLIDKCALDLCDFVTMQQTDGKLIEWDLKDLLAKCLVGVIGSCAFGIDINCFEDADNEFNKAATYLMSQSDFRKVAKILLFMVCPEICKKLGFQVFDDKYKRLFRFLVAETINIRQKNNEVRPDLIQLLLQAKQGEFKNETQAHEAKTQPIQWTDDELTAQAVIFFAAGFETTSTLLSFAMMELALQPTIQNRLIEEIDNLKENNPTYEQIQNLQYLNAVVCESLRKWPPLPATDRICVKNYTIINPDSQLSLHDIEVDRPVWIPIYCFHHDPQYFPEPEVFNPNRFLDPNRNAINEAAFMPFGVGPRNCIGSRFGLLAAKLILVRIMRAYRIECCTKTDDKMSLSKSKMSMILDKGHWVHLKLRNKNFVGFTCGVIR